MGEAWEREIWRFVAFCRESLEKPAARLLKIPERAPFAWKYSRYFLSREPVKLRPQINFFKYEKRA